MQPRHRTTSRTRSRSGFSMVEFLLALTISAMLLTSAMVALDSMFKGYKQTTESASTHVVTRIVMNRMLGMVRTGTDFGPIPTDVLDSTENPRGANYFEFASAHDSDGEITEITRIEYRLPGQQAELLDWGAADGPPEPDEDDGDGDGDDDEEVVVVGPGELWYVLIDPNDGDPIVTQEHPLLSGVRSVVFTLHYDVGPKLRRATIDLIIEPNDSVDLTIAADSVPETIRLVASAAPRQTLD